MELSAISALCHRVPRAGIEYVVSSVDSCPLPGAVYGFYSVLDSTISRRTDAPPAHCLVIGCFAAGGGLAAVVLVRALPACGEVFGFSAFQADWASTWEGGACAFAEQAEFSVGFSEAGFRPVSVEFDEFVAAATERDEGDGWVCPEQDSLGIVRVVDALRNLLAAHALVVVAAEDFEPECRPFR